MFNDNKNPHREEWTYEYLASDLLPKAKELHTRFFQKEKEARDKMSDFMKDMNISQSDPRISDTKREIGNFGMLREQCAVWIHEFNRNITKVFVLGLGDVTFFELEKQ